MKYIETLIIGPKDFIKKNLLTNIKISELRIDEINNAIEYNSGEFKIDSEDLNDYRNYIQNNDPNDFKNVNKYNEYYDFISEKILDKQYLSINDDYEKSYDLSKLDSLFFKSSKYAFLYIQNNVENKKKLDLQLIKKLEKAILQNFQNAITYVQLVLNDRWEELEFEIINQDDPEYFESYLEILIKIFEKYGDKKSEKFTDNYNKSNIFKKFINHNLTITSGLYDFNFWNPIIDKILINKAELYLNYYDSIFSETGTNEDTLKMKENIMNDPEKIALYYTNTNIPIKLPKSEEEKQKIFNALSKYPNQLIFFAYSRYKQNDNNIFIDFPNFINDAIKSNDIHMFYYFLTNISLNKIKKITSIDYWDQNKISDYINDYKKQFKEVRDYMYKTYKPFIEKIGEDPFYSLKYANLTLYPFPFKEGEQKILNSMLQRRDYLYLIKMLGPSIVPNYSDYDLTMFNQGDHDQ